jgi:tRNA A-37 threonylcarbamoyl transferase component Bud32
MVIRRGRRHEIPMDQPFERSPADVLRLVVAAAGVLIVLGVEWVFGDALVAFASDLLRGIDAVPTWIVDVVVVGTRILGVCVFAGLLWWLLRGRRWRMLATVAAAGLVAAGLVTLLDALIETDPRRVLVDTGVDLLALTYEGFPSKAGMAAIVGVLTAAAPWLGRRWRQAGWALIVGLTVTGFMHSPVSFDSILALAVGWFSGAAVLVAAGAPTRRPTSQAVIDGLCAVGLPVQRLEQAGVDARGSTPYFGVGVDGSKLFVKVLGADERSADLLFRLYRRLQPRNFGDERSFSSLRRAVEHEAFAALVAHSLGVRTPQVRALATADPNGFVLAYDAIAGRSLDRVEPSEVTDDVLAAIWSLVGELRRHRISHRDLRLANVFLDDGDHVWLIDFGFSEVAASDLLLATDVAELLASSSLCVGAQRATASAVSMVAPATLAQALDRLHPWALSGATRTELKGRPGLLDSLRSELAVTIPGDGR